MLGLCSTLAALLVILAGSRVARAHLGVLQAA
jgi:hypothetical protein